MTEKKDLHVHTDMSDAIASPEVMVQAAIAAEMDVLGISDHSPAPFDPGYALTEETLPAYKAEIARLKEKYAGEITVLCGIEQDYFSEGPAEGYDYVIGSVHYVKPADEYVTIDDDKERIVKAAEKYYGGDIYSLLEDYYRLEADVVRKTGATIIGHFDVIAKQNKKEPFFDEHHPRYVAAWQKAADELLKTGALFEINTAPLYRGLREEPYLTAEMRQYIRERGGRFILSSDSHSPGTLCAAFAVLEDEI